MMANYSRYVVPALGACCVAGAITVGVALRAPQEVEIAVAAEAANEAPLPKKLELANDVPTMEQVVEKHLFVKERKATGANTFPDLLVKGVYVGSKCSVVLSLKSKPQANLRVWQDDVSSIVKQITDSRDLRKPIVDFLNEWDIKEISFKGLTVEHFITGEVETYAVDYTPAKHVKDSALAGYGQGMLAEAAEGGGAERSNKSASTPQVQGQQQAQGQMMSQLRDMLQTMTPEQRARLAQRITEGSGGGQSSGGSRSGGDSRDQAAASNNSKSSNSKSSNTSREGSSSRSGRSGR